MKHQDHMLGAEIDFAACEAEPIHVAESIQPHGILLVLAIPDLVVLQASANAGAVLPTEVERAIGRKLPDLLPPDGISPLRDLLAQLPEHGAHHLGIVTLATGNGDHAFHAAAHRRNDALILELEPVTAPASSAFENLYPLVRTFLETLPGVSTIEALSALAAREVRRITGFDRVLIYRFDEQWNGTVIAEDRNERLPSYLDLRFPASDLPPQVRDLYRLNRLRLIADADYQPVPIVPQLNPLTNRPIDLSMATLRSISPVHIEHMKSTGIAASMSISILKDGELWGLISCHNKTALLPSPHRRTACDFLGQILALQLAAKDYHIEAEHRMTLRSVQSQLLGFMAAEEQFVDGLIKHPAELLQLAAADGAAIVFGGSCTLLGNTPSERDVRHIVDWLSRTMRDGVFSTDSLAAVMSGAEAYKEQGSGLLAISISQIHSSYILWFRPEVVQTVKWGGDPRRPVEPTEAGVRLHPQKSFGIWKETVRLRSLPWQPSEIDAVKELRKAIVDIVLRKAEELAELTNELRRSNKELEAFSYSVSHDLRAPFRHIVGYSELLREQEADRLSDRGRRFVDTIVESALSAGRLVDDLLNFSRMGRAQITPIMVDMNQLVAEIRQRLESEAAGRKIVWMIADLEPVWADPTMLRLAVVNLLSNALKYTRGRDETVIQVDCRKSGDETVFLVRDNGVGFDMTYVDKLFGVFQRLHRMEDFEGTGIGLANVRRIIDRHGGRTWAEGAVDGGATFYFSLPNRPDAE